MTGKNYQFFDFKFSFGPLLVDTRNFEDQNAEYTEPFLRATLSKTANDELKRAAMIAPVRMNSEMTRVILGQRKPDVGSNNLDPNHSRSSID